MGSDKESLVFRVYPLERNKILARFENLADRFDTDAKAEFVDLNQFAKTFFYDANKNTQYDLSHVEYTEVSLSNNQPLKDIKNFEWRGVDDDTFKGGPSPTPDNGTKIALDPQAIRQFTFHYTKRKPAAS